MKAIIFDCDGTLVDSEMTHFLAWNHALEKQGACITLEEYFTHVGATNDRTSLNHGVILVLGAAGLVYYWIKNKDRRHL